MGSARAQPGRLNVGTIAVGSTQNLGAELFKSAAGLDFQIVPYRGTPDVIVALLRNDVQLMIDFYGPMKPTLLERKIQPGATSGLQRSPFFSDVPTVAEAGSPATTSRPGMAFCSGRNPDGDHRPAEQVDSRGGGDPEVKQRYADLGIEAKASTPEQLKARLETTSGNGRN